MASAGADDRARGCAAGSEAAAPIQAARAPPIGATFGVLVARSSDNEANCVHSATGGNMHACTQGPGDTDTVSALRRRLQAAKCDP